MEKYIHILSHNWHARGKKNVCLPETVCPILALKPHQLTPISSENNSLKLPLDDKHAIWTAGLAVFGSLFEPAIIFAADSDPFEVTKGSEHWESMIEKAPALKSPDEVLEVCHDLLCKAGVNKMIRQPEDWDSVAQSAPTSLMATTLAQMLKTPPENMLGWTEKGLTFSTIGAYWISIQKAWGSRWIVTSPKGKRINTSETPPSMKEKQFAYDHAPSPPKASVLTPSPKSKQSVTQPKKKKTT